MDRRGSYNSSPFVSGDRRKRAYTITSSRFRKQKGLEKPDKAISGGVSCVRSWTLWVL